MTVPIVILLLIVALVVAVVWALQRRTAEAGAKQAHLHENERSSTLAYLVPPGQDPAVLVAALEQCGYAAAAETTGGPLRLLVDAGPHGRSREDVRAVIEGVRTSALDDGQPVRAGAVRFEDEDTP